MRQFLKSYFTGLVGRTRWPYRDHFFTELLKQVLITFGTFQATLLNLNFVQCLK